MPQDGQSTDKTPKPGDRIVVKRSDGQYDVRKIGASGEIEAVRTGIASLEQARHIARANLQLRGRMWVEDHSAPNVFDRL